jgi:hypothetical protein
MRKVLGIGDIFPDEEEAKQNSVSDESILENGAWHSENEYRRLAYSKSASRLSKCP